MENEVEKLRAFYTEIVNLTLGHDVIADHACVMADKLGEALERVNKEWYRDALKDLRNTVLKFDDPCERLGRSGRRINRGFMLDYPVQLAPAQEGGFVVTFPDIPEVITQGEDLEEALINAQDALETALSFYISGGRDIPTPSASDDRPVVAPSALGCAKIGVYQAMRAQGVSKAQLALMLNWQLLQVDQLLDLCHTGKLDQVEAALAALDCIDLEGETSWQQDLKI